MRITTDQRVTFDLQSHEIGEALLDADPEFVADVLSVLADGEVRPCGSGATPC